MAQAFTRARGPPGSLVTYANICDPTLDLGVHDWVMSFEVGEHLPTACLATYLHLLDRSNRRGIILSWSHHESGHCHVNARDSHTLDCTLEMLGYQIDKLAVIRGRHRARIAWMRHGFLVFQKQTVA